MSILQIIMGCIMGIYLMKIISDNLVTKKIPPALERNDNQPEGRKGNIQKHFLEDDLS
jgi:hypothetical protein